MTHIFRTDMGVLIANAMRKRKPYHVNIWQVKGVDGAHAGALTHHSREEADDAKRVVGIGARCLYRVVVRFKPGRG